MSEPLEESLTCGEQFYGHLEPGDRHMDFSVPRWCNEAKGHRGEHRFDRGLDAVLRQVGAEVERLRAELARRDA